MTLARRVAAEIVGTMFLLAAIVGSGIMGERLAAGNTAIALLANAVATGAVLTALLLTFGPVSGAHFNPAVTLVSAAQKERTWSEAFAYVLGQVLGAFLGVCTAHLMFAEPVIQVSTHARAGLPQMFSEFIATFGLLGVVISCARQRPGAVPAAVGLYITGAYWFTASTSFANPAVTLARAWTNTFSGISPSNVPGFIVAQALGAVAASLFFTWLVPRRPRGVGSSNTIQEGD